MRCSVLNHVPGLVVTLTVACASAAAGQTTVTLEGTVLEGGVALAGALLRFEPIEVEEDAEPAEGGVVVVNNFAGTYADQDGWYLLDDVLPGRWRVVIQPRPRKGVFPSVSYIPPAPGWDRSLPREFEITVPPEAEVEQDFNLEIAEVAGRVLYGPDRTPLGHVAVVLERPESRVGSALHRKLFRHRWVCARTDTEGRFRFRGLEAGSYRVIAGGPAPSWAPNYRSSEPAPVEVHAGSVAGDVEIVLDAPGRVLAGRVLGADGQPLSGGNVYFFNALGEEETSSAWIVTDENGEFQAVGLGPDPYTLVVARPMDRGRDTFFPAVCEAVTAPVERDAIRTLHLTSGTRVNVSVTWTQRDKADEYPEIEVFGPRGIALGRFTNYSSGSGLTVDAPFPRPARYSSDTSLAPGRYTIAVRAGGREGRQEIEVGSAEANLRFDLTE